MNVKLQTGVLSKYPYCELCTPLIISDYSLTVNHSFTFILVFIYIVAQCIMYIYVYATLYINPLHCYVECDSTSVFISAAPLSSPTFFCVTCERKGLHPGNCFKIYHTLKNQKIQQQRENWYLNEFLSSLIYLNCLIFQLE